MAPFSSCPQSFPASECFPVSQVAKVLELQPQHQSFQWIFRLISLRIDRFDLLVILGTLKSLLHHHNLKASILWHSDVLFVQFSHPYVTTGKTIALTIRTFVSKVMSLLHNMLSKIGTLSIIVLFLWWINDWGSRTAHVQSFNRPLIILVGPRAAWSEMSFAAKPRLWHKVGVRG